MQNTHKICELAQTKSDFLYLFLGIYALGVWIYNKSAKTVIDENQVIRNNIDDCSSKQNFYSVRFHLAIQNVDCVKGMDVQRVAEIKNLGINVTELNKNKDLKKFIEIYFSASNVIPIWPGGNVLKGKSGVFDIPELFFCKIS